MFSVSIHPMPTLLPYGKRAFGIGRPLDGKADCTPRALLRASHAGRHGAALLAMTRKDENPAGGRADGQWPSLRWGGRLYDETEFFIRCAGGGRVWGIRLFLSNMLKNEPRFLTLTEAVKETIIMLAKFGPFENSFVRKNKK